MEPISNLVVAIDFDTLMQSALAIMTTFSPDTAPANHGCDAMRDQLIQAIWRLYVYRAIREHGASIEEAQRIADGELAQHGGLLEARHRQP